MCIFVAAPPETDVAFPLFQVAVHTVATAPTNCTGTGGTTRCQVVSLLDTELEGASFHLGTLRVECSARVWSLYYGSVHRDVLEEKPRLGASVLGNRESAGG